MSLHPGPQARGNLRGPVYAQLVEERAKALTRFLEPMTQKNVASLSKSSG